MERIEGVEPYSAALGRRATQPVCLSANAKRAAERLGWRPSFDLWAGSKFLGYTLGGGSRKPLVLVPCVERPYYQRALPAVFIIQAKRRSAQTLKIVVTHFATLIRLSRWHMTRKVSIPQSLSSSRTSNALASDDQSASGAALRDAIRLSSQAGPWSGKKSMHSSSNALR